MITKRNQKDYNLTFLLAYLRLFLLILDTIDILC